LKISAALNLPAPSRHTVMIIPLVALARAVAFFIAQHTQNSGVFAHGVFQLPDRLADHLTAF
jgi:predicted RecA/RadA family phage recombinase